MLTTSQIEFALRSFQNLQKDFLATIDRIVDSVAIFSAATVDVLIREADEKLVRLTVNLEPHNSPPWIKKLSEAFKAFRTNKPSTIDALRRDAVKEVIANLQDAKSHRWEFSPSEENAVRYDRIFEEAYSSTRLPTIFDKLIAQLDGIIAAGLVDDTRALHALENLLATLKQKTKNTYYATYGKIRLLKNIGKNVMFEFLKLIPGVKPVWTAIEKSIEEADKELKKLNSEVDQKECNEAMKKISLTLESEHAPLAIGYTPKEQHHTRLSETGSQPAQASANGNG